MSGMSEQYTVQLLHYYAQAYADSSNRLEKFTQLYQQWMQGEASVLQLKYTGEEVNAANQEMMARFVQLEGLLPEEQLQQMYLDVCFQLEATHTIFNNAMMAAI